MNRSSALVLNVSSPLASIAFFLAFSTLDARPISKVASESSLDMCTNSDFPSDENVSWLPIPNDYHDDDDDGDDELMMMVIMMVVVNVRSVMSGTNYLIVPP